MAEVQPHEELPAQFVVGEHMMIAWFESMLAMSEQCVRLWTLPFAPPLEHAHEPPGELEMPGPLERDHEHNLFA
ncbi:MAG: hypothetical protein KDE15_01470 [Erythrobacter sp.]|nr:hypothetical protein [Erythrobacter sp.]